ncbi:MAG: hypothetical protein M1389_08825 [Chloroflexi bacterium]|nr:hypothetical protein [Chloroflexota bacterium]MDA8219305.1 hypothetical protein [Dehalococcoidales bacterium]
MVGDASKYALAGSPVVVLATRECVEAVVSMIDRWVHKLRNGTRKVPARWRKGSLVWARTIYQAPTKGEARARFATVSKEV